MKTWFQIFTLLRIVVQVICLFYSFLCEEIKFTKETTVILMFCVNINYKTRENYFKFHLALLQFHEECVVFTWDKI